MTHLLKKVASGVVAMAVVATSAINLGTVASAQFVSAEFTDAFEWLSDNGITSMPTEQAYSPFVATNREQGTTLIVRALEVIENQCNVDLLTMDPNASCGFGDAASIDGTLVAPVNDACNYGLVNGYNGNFWPTQLMSRAQVMTVLGRAMYGQQTEPAQYWTNYYSLLNADGIFTVENANANIMRYELGLVLHRIAMSECGTATDDGGDDLDDILCQLLGTCDDTPTDPVDPVDPVEPTDPTPTTPTPTVGGNLQVSVSASSPASMDVPENAIVHAASYDFTAGTDGTAKVYSMTVSLVGLNNSCTLDSVAAFNSAGRITNARSFNSDDEATLSFIGGIDVAAGSTETIHLVVDTLDDSCLPGDAQSTQFAFDIVEVNANAGLVYNSTLTATHEILNVTAAQLTIKDDGTPADVNVGDMGAEIANFSLEGDSDNDIEVHSITLRDDESIADNAFANFELRCDNDMVGSLDYTMNGYVTINFDTPLLVQEDEDVDCELVADVVAEPNEYFRFYLDDTLDVVATDVDFNDSGVGIINQYDVTDTSLVLIEAGDISISKINIMNDQVRTDYDDAIIAEFDITSAAGQPVEWRDVAFRIIDDGTTNICTYLEASEFELWDEDTGSRYSLDVDNCDGDMIISDDDVSIILDEGTKSFTLRASTLDATGIAGNEFNVEWNRSNNDFRELSDDEQITDITPSNITWQAVEIVDSGLTLTVLPMGSVNAVVGYQDLEVLDFELEAEDYNAVEADEIRVKGTLINGSSSSDYDVYVDADSVFAAGDVLTINIMNGSATVETATLTIASPTSVQAQLATVIAGMTNASATNSTSNIDVTLTSSAYSLDITNTGAGNAAAVPGAVSTAGVVTEDEIAAVYLYRVEDDGTLTLLDSESDIVNGIVEFDNLGEILDADEDVEYSVLVDLVDDTNNSGMMFRFEVYAVDADDDQNDSVFVAQDTDQDTILEVAALSTRIVTISSVGSLTAITDSSDVEVSVAELVLGGTYSDIVAAFEMTATDEDIMINDLVITAAGGNPTLASHVSELQIYDENMNLIDSESVTDDTVEFDNINYTVLQGTETLYIVAKAQLIGYGNPGVQSTPLTLTLDIVDADGVDSGDPITAAGDASVTPSQSFSVVPVLVTNVAAASTTCSQLAVGSTVARVNVTALNSNNTTVLAPGNNLDTVLNQLKFRVYPTAIDMALTTFSLERVNPIDPATNSLPGTVTNIGGVDYVVFDLSLLGWDTDNAEVNGTVEYRVRVDAFGDLTPLDGDDSKISLELDETSADSVVYMSDDAGAAPINYILGSDIAFGTCAQ